MLSPEYNLSEVAMSLRSRRVGLVLLLMFSAGTLAAQSRVNPTVKIRPGAAAPVPLECEEGVAPQPMLRADLRDLVQEPDPAADMVAPPSRDLRSSLAAAQAAARNNDRESFRQALAASKAMLVNYPPGGEKNAASEVIAIYDDLDRVWDYQFSSPVGSFFDASVQGGNLLSTLQKYRGYDESVRRQIYTDANGVRLYPTRESRDFLAREAGERLARLGIRDAVPSRAQPQPPPRVVTERAQPAPASKPATVVQSPVSKPAPRPTARSTSSTPKRKPARSTTRRAAAKVEPISEPPQSEPSDDPDPVPSQSIVSPAPPGTTPASETTTETTTEPTTTAAMSETTMTDSAAAVDTAVATESVGQTDPQRAPTRTRSVILPIILILIGVGVLIVLFRASS